MYIDTHVHLNNKVLYKHLQEVMNDAINNNVKKFIVVGYDLETSKLAIELAEKYDNCYASIGFHPTEIKTYGDAEYNWLDEMACHPKVIAIGEIGYDFHWDTTTPKEQGIAFIRQIKIALNHNLPLIIHSRDALQITYNTLKQEHADQIGGVMHSYSGSVEIALAFTQLNFKIGISGPVTFVNGRVAKEVVKKIPLKYLLTETDSPYLTPHPYRGTENGPKYIPLIVDEIARLKGVDKETVEREVEQNVKELFGI